MKWMLDSFYDEQIHQFESMHVTDLCIEKEREIWMHADW